MMRPLVFVLLAFLSFACQPPSNEPSPGISATTAETAQPWTSLAALDEPDDFHFAVVTDRTGSHRAGVFAGAMPKINLLAPAFVVSVGDLIEGYTEDQAVLDREWDEMEGFIGQLEAPFFYTAGNHDMNNAVMAETWRQRFGPSYYHFKYKDVLFLVLNSELFGMVEDPDTPVPGPWRQEDQMAFAKQVLGQHSDVRWTIVLVHQPLWDPGPNREINGDWLAIEDLLGPRPYTVFAGHYHQYTKARRHDRNYITLATTGGGSDLRGPLWGEFDHVAMVSMTDAGPRIANLLLDGIHDENVATVTTRAMVEALTKAIVVKPAVADEEMFNTADAIMEITNPTTADLHIAPHVSQRGNFQIKGLQGLTLAAGEKRTFNLALSSEKPTLYRDLKPATVDWTLTGADATERVVQITTKTPILPLTQHPIGRTATAPTIDGKLDDWGTLPFLVDRQGDIASPATETADISFRFGVSHDDSNLYIGVSVTDDSIVADESRIARQQDAIAIIVDTRDDDARNKSMSVVPAILNGFYNEMMVQILSIAEPAEDTFVYTLKEYEKLVTSAVARTDSGYAVELAVPVAVLNKYAPNNRWHSARIGVRAYDYDEGEGNPQVLHWQPYRFGNAPLAGTHAFVKSN